MMIKVHLLNHTTFTALLGGHLLLLLRPSRQSYTPLQSCYIHLWVHMFVHSLQQKSESWTLFSMIDIMSSSTHGVVHSELTELFYFRSANQIYNINSQGYRYHDMPWHDVTWPDISSLSHWIIRMKSSWMTHVQHCLLYVTSARTIYSLSWNRVSSAGEWG